MSQGEFSVTLKVGGVPKLAVVLAALLPAFVRVKVPDVVVDWRMIREFGLIVPLVGVVSAIVESVVVLCTARLPKRSTKLTLAVMLPPLPRAGFTVHE